MKAFFGTTVADIFDTMPRRFKPDEARDVDVVIGYEAKGEGGGKWKVTIQGGTIRVETVEGDLTGCNTKVHADSAETLIGVTLGKIPAIDALTSQRLRVVGDPRSLLTLLPRIFAPYAAPERKKEVAAQDIIATVAERFRPEKAEGMDVSVGYDLTGDGAGSWTILIRDGTCRVQEGLAEPLSVKMTMEAATYVGMMLGTLDPLSAFTSGKVKIEGDMMAAGATTKCFRAFVDPRSQEAEELICLRTVNAVRQRFATGPVMGRWFAGLREKTFLANKCPVCGRTQIPPREICAVCRVRVTEFVEVGPKGTVTNFDIVYFSSPDPLTGLVRETPYAPVYVVLDGATDTEAFAMEIRRDQIDRLKVGARVRPVWAEHTTGSFQDLIGFELDDREEDSA